MKYSEDHVWTVREGGEFRIGITDYAQDEMGEISFLEIEPPGTHVEKGDPLGSIDSLKSTSDIYAPFACTIVRVNAAVVSQDRAGAAGDPKLVNRDATGEGWIAILEADSPADFDLLMNDQTYRAYIGS